MNPPAPDIPQNRPPIAVRAVVRCTVATARLIAHLPPKRLQALLRAARRGAEPATYAQALAAREHVTSVSVLCSGRYCLQRSLAVALLCRLRGTWPTWRTGVRTSPFVAHAWVEAEGRRVGEPDDTGDFHPMLSVPPLTATRGATADRS
ncbi:lasso peptide biosynthesis B2 protein [Kitasatospora sp. cg17-2]